MTNETNDLQNDELTPERLIKEERIAILKAVRCPGKTHSMIKNPALRRSFAHELNDLRNQAIRAKHRKNLPTDEFWRGICWGMEGAYWSMQKEENWIFVNEGRRVTWHLREPEDRRTPEEHQQYDEFIEKVKSVHMKALKIEQEILADHQAGKISDHQKSRSLREMWDQERAKIKKLQREYGQ